MARIDSLLAIVNQQAANELRMGTDREPKMFAYGSAKRLSIPMTPSDTLRDLLGEILTPEREQAMRAKGRLEATYDGGVLGAFQVTLIAREGGFDVTFLRSARTRERPSDAASPAVEASPAVAQPPPGSASNLPIATPPAVAARFGDEEEPTGGSLLAAYVVTAASLRASDLHLADGEPPSVRVDGRLHRLDLASAVDVATTLGLGDAERAYLARGDSIDSAREVVGVGRVRVHVFQSSAGLAAAVRLLPRTAPSLASLHLPLPLEDLAELPHGLVLVCGASGSGKSTTLAALAQEALRRRSIVLTTLEDPIEFALSPPETSLARRRQIGRDVRDFATGLRDALREDPDVLLVGEMRDKETIRLALTAAETGHLVLSSLHSRSAASAIERIVDVFPAEGQTQVRTQLADSLRAVVVQRLLPRARGEGRIPVVEVLRMTHAVGALIREGKTSQIASTLQSGKREGMLSLERCLADRVQAGEIRLEDARAAANEPSSLTSYLAR
ncbi:MAG: type IV pilus twitching motility protein PilT [Polyangiaceae bacterium]|jgi:twitching motility protein PilT